MPGTVQTNARFAVLVVAALAGSVNAATELLYVANNHDGMVSVIAIPEFEVIGEIDVIPDQSLGETGGSTYADDVVVSSDGSRMYVSRGGHRDVAAFGLPDGDLLWRVGTDGHADHFALSPDGSVLFVSVYSEDRVHVMPWPSEVFVQLRPRRSGHDRLPV